MPCTLTISPTLDISLDFPSLKPVTHPSLVGVAAPDALPGVNLPRLRSCASRSFASRASARRLRKSERLTRPTVWDLRRSSAVEACEVKRLVGSEGVEVRDGGLVGGLELAMLEVWGAYEAVLS